MVYVMHFKPPPALLTGPWVSAASASGRQTCQGSGGAGARGQRGLGLSQSRGCPAQPCLPPPAVMLLPAQP